jgi:hypothetical protein
MLKILIFLHPHNAYNPVLLAMSQMVTNVLNVKIIAKNVKLMVYVYNVPQINLY